MGAEERELESPKERRKSKYAKELMLFYEHSESEQASEVVSPAQGVSTSSGSMMMLVPSGVHKNERDGDQRVFSKLIPCIPTCVVYKPS